MREIIDRELSARPCFQAARTQFDFHGDALVQARHLQSDGSSDGRNRGGNRRKDERKHRQGRSCHNGGRPPFRRQFKRQFDQNVFGRKMQIPQRRVRIRQIDGGAGVFRHLRANRLEQIRNTRKGTQRRIAARENTRRLCGVPGKGNARPSGRVVPFSRFFHD